MSHWQGYFVSNLKINSAGVRIQEVRGKLGISEFAEELGVNRKTVSRWEADETLPDGASLLALKDKFGADPAWILTGSGEAPNTSSLTPDEQVLLDGYRALDVPTRRRMLAFMLGGGDATPGQAQSNVSVTASGRGAQAAGRKIVNKGKNGE